MAKGQRIITLHEEELKKLDWYISERNIRDPIGNLISSGMMGEIIVRDFVKGFIDKELAKQRITMEKMVLEDDNVL